MPQAASGWLPNLGEPKWLFPFPSAPAKVLTDALAEGAGRSAESCLAGSGQRPPTGMSLGWRRQVPPPALFICGKMDESLLQILGVDVLLLN